jgi:hypothetical protein
MLDGSHNGELVNVSRAVVTAKSKYFTANAFPDSGEPCACRRAFRALCLESR